MLVRRRAPAGAVAPVQLTPAIVKGMGAGPGADPAAAPVAIMRLPPPPAPDSGMVTSFTGRGADRAAGNGARPATRRATDTARKAAREEARTDGMGKN
jgi:hypothetical protein